MAGNILPFWSESSTQQEQWGSFHELFLLCSCFATMQFCVVRFLLIKLQFFLNYLGTLLPPHPWIDPKLRESLCKLTIWTLWCLLTPRPSMNAPIRDVFDCSSQKPVRRHPVSGFPELFSPSVKRRPGEAGCRGLRYLWSLPLLGFPWLPQ